MREIYNTIRRKARDLEKQFVNFVENSGEKNIRFEVRETVCFQVDRYFIKGQPRSWSVLKAEQNTVLPIEDVLSIINKLLKKFARSRKFKDVKYSYEKKKEDLNTLLNNAEILERSEVIQTLSSSSDFNEESVEVDEEIVQELRDWANADDVGVKLSIPRSEQSSSNVGETSAITHQFINDIIACIQKQYQYSAQLKNAAQAFMEAVTKLSQEDAAYYYDNIAPLLNLIGK